MANMTKGNEISREATKMQNEAFATLQERSAVAFENSDKSAYSKAEADFQKAMGKVASMMTEANRLWDRRAE